MKLNFDELIKKEKINHGNKGLCDDDLDVLCHVIEQSKVLERLRLSYNKLTLADGKLANAIATNTTLKRLYLYNNKISDEGAKLLANALKKNNTLEGLDLSENNIGDDGARCIAEVLAVNKTLQWIHLGNNNIGDKGAESIATSLVVNRGIGEIYLNDNNIGDKGAKKLQDTLECNHLIKTFSLGWNNINSNVNERINTILNDSKRSDTPQSSLDKLELYIAKNNKRVKTAMAVRNREKDEKSKDKDAEIAKKDRDLAKKDKQITSLKTAIRVQLQQLDTIIDPVDLTSEEDTEPPNKRTRVTEEDTPKSALAIQHEQNQQYSQRLVQVKQENIND